METSPQLKIAGALTVVAGVLASGCIGQVDTYYGFDLDEPYLNPGVFPGQYLPPGDGGSSVLKNGFLLRGDPVVYHLRSAHGSELVPVQPHEPNTNEVLITLAVWMPVGHNAPDQVPVIADIGPYYESGNVCEPGSNPCRPVPASIRIPQQTTPFLLKNFLPKGYAVAQVAVRGTGTSGGCMELMGPREAADASLAVAWLGKQEWSNGHVALTGASYDGSTPWMVASTGNEYLKTIVPVAGLPDIWDLMFHNGTAEGRGAIMHSQVYWPYGFGNDWPHPQFPLGIANNRDNRSNLQNLFCKDAAEGFATGPYSTFMGDRGASDYWRLRDHRDNVIKNYKGSVLLVHGLQDWNVDPHAAIPFNVRLREAGIPVKELYGQWGHAFPDSTCPISPPKWMTFPCRLDYAEILDHWFDYYLRGNTTVYLGPMVQVQDDRGYWRNAEAFPPSHPDWLQLYPTGAGALAATPEATEQQILLSPYGRSQVANAAAYLEFKTEPMPEDVRISGMPQFHIEFESEGSDGLLSAWMFDENATGMVLDRWGLVPRRPGGPPQDPVPFSSFGVPPIIGHGQMDLRYYAGGEERQTLAPGQRHRALLEFEPLEVLIPKGHRITVWLSQLPYPDHNNAPVPTPVRVFLGGTSEPTVLRLSTVTVDPSTIFPVPGAHFPKPENFERHHVPKPAFSNPQLPAASFLLGTTAQDGRLLAQ